MILYDSVAQKTIRYHPFYRGKKLAGNRNFLQNSDKNTHKIDDNLIKVPLIPEITEANNKYEQ